MSLQAFCSKNNVPYNIFHKWYKDTHRKIVEVQVNGVRAVFSFRGKNCKEGESLFPLVGHRHRKPYKAPRVLPVRISVELTLSSGLHILPKDLDSLDLYRPNQKQEDPCRV